ncbi:MobQ family relaxase [Paracoccus chinensis]|uniref:Plasmid mobilization system relaxase n=1 Tax=Paracoccus chinensis TaxID=525640 RepID=A0A1G9NAU3_9RHOB|nr:MobQ family relaxase [Paracoccus chinensis]SDL83441.1 plasmid mobilization system relaxase [Paracoccus chinensis]
MASYHLSVKTIKRSAGRSATAAAAYRAGCEIVCAREGRMHDYTRKAGVEDSFILAPDNAPDWAQDRAALWNAAEARETRANSVTAREWELALPAELDATERRMLVMGFAAELVSRYGVAADVAIHAPHRDGDQRNHHAHVLTTTRVLTAEGLTDKTRVLDAKATGGPEIEAMRARWAELQNLALERQGHEVRVDHRSLVAQREAALAEGHEFRAEELDRAPEIKLGPAASAIERREMQAAWYEDRDYVPVTERGAAVQAARQERALLAELRARLELARETYTHAREEGADRVTAGLAALRAAARKHGVDVSHKQEQAREHTLEAGSIRDRLARILDRGSGRKEAEVAYETGPEHEGDDIRARLGRIFGREAEQAEPEAGGSAHGQEARSIRERLQAVLAREKPVARERLDREHGHERGEGAHRHRDRGDAHEL